MSAMRNEDAVQTLRELPHVTDEQFACMLFGETPAEVRSHLDVCPECAAEAERACSAVGSFERDSRLWAERRASATPTVYPERRPIPVWLQVPTGWAVAAVAMVIATTIGLPHFDARSGVAGRASDVTVVSTVTTATEVPAATIKSDNELLAAIDGKLNSNETPSAQFYGLQVDERVPQSSTSHEVAD